MINLYAAQEDGLKASTSVDEVDYGNGVHVAFTIARDDGPEFRDLAILSKDQARELYGQLQRLFS